MSTIKLFSDKNKLSLMAKAIRYLSVICVSVLLGYITSRPSLILYFDATEPDSNTISVKGQELLESLDGKLEITSYVNMADNNAYIGSPRMINNDLDWFHRFSRFKSDMTIDYVYYYDEPLRNRGYVAGETSAEDLARAITKIYNMNFNNILKPTEIKELIDLYPEENSFVRLAKLENGKSCFIRIYNDPARYPTETEMLGSLSRLINNPPQLSFLTGNGEPSAYRKGDTDFADFATTLSNRHSLVNQGYDINEIQLNHEHQGSNLIDSTDVLIVADPKTPLDAYTTKKIIGYLESGRNMLITYEPGRENNMKEITDFLDLKFMPGVLVYPEQDFLPTLIPSRLAFFSTELSYLYSRMGPTKAITMPGCVGLDFKLDNKFEVIPVAATPPRGSWNEIETTNLFSSLVFNRDAGEVQRAIPTVLALTRQVNGKEQRILVLGDTDCLGNAEQKSKRDGLPSDNKLFVKASFNWLSDGELPIDVSREPSKDNMIKLSMNEMTVWGILLVWLIPSILASIGIFICIRRKRR